MMEYYILDSSGNPVGPVTQEEYYAWISCLGKDRYEEVRRVGGDTIGDFYVSTVFMGMDHYIGSGKHAPVLWETMIFDNSKDKFHDEYCARYTSLEDSLHGHMEAMATAESWMALKRTK